MEHAGMAMQWPVEPEFSSTALSVHVPKVLQLGNAVVPRRLLSIRGQRRWLSSSSPSAMANYMSISRPTSSCPWYQVNTMGSPAHLSFAAAVGMDAAYAIGGVEGCRPPRPPLQHFSRSVSSLVLFPLIIDFLRFLFQSAPVFYRPV